MRAGLERVLGRDGLDLELVPAPRGATLEHGDVPAVGVDVQVVRIEMPDDDLHAARSQYCGTWPRLETIRRSASIAVYVGSTTSSPPSGVSSSPRSRPRSSDGNDLDRLGVEPGVLEAERELGRAVARDDHALEPVEQRLEVDVPDPRHVLAVRDRVVQRDDGERRGGARDQRPHRLVRARGVLDQEHQQPAAVHLDPLEAPEGGIEALETRDDLVERGAERAGERRRGERVVDVVEARQAERDPALLARAHGGRTTRSPARRARSPSPRA